MNVRLEDGTIRCNSHFDASDYVAETIEACTYCTPEEDAEILFQAAQAIIDAVVIVEGPKATVEAPKEKAPKPFIGKRYAEESYYMRGTATRKGDKVTRYRQRIGRTAYEVAQIDWAAGGREITVYLAGTTTVVHEF